MSRTPARDGNNAGPPGLSGYRFIEDIGAGGNAQVYLYEQNLPRRKVAVKVLNESALSEAARRRFITEANVTAGLPHRHIVQVFDAKVTDDGRPYIVMPYYPQPNLSVRARRSHFSVADVLRIGIQIGSAVETSHRGGVLHRDIKPQNILSDSYGEPALTDFGIATTKGGDGPEGLSVPWSPPEILFGTSAGDQRADVYSLGATLWHLLAGRSPFEVPGDNGTLALMGRIKSDPPPRTQRADVPDSLERLLRQAMAKNPAARPQSAMELIRGLQSVEQELRLPLTQPILAADEPSGDTQGSDTIALRRGRGGEDTFTRGFGPPPGGAGPLDQPRGNTVPPAAGPGGPRAHAGLPPDLEPDLRQQAPPARGNTSRSTWGSAPRDDATARGPGAPGPWAPPPGPGQRASTAGTRPADDSDKATLKRGPIRIDPSGHAAVTRDQASHQARPARLEAWASAPAPGTARVRHFPREAPEGATVARSRAAAPGSADFSGPTDAGHGPTAASPSGAAGPGHRKRGQGRVLALAGGAAALAVVAGVAVVILTHGGGQPGNAPGSSPAATQAGGAQNALGLDAAPGTPVIKATRLSPAQVRFTWTYDNSAATDEFEWSVAGTVPASTGKAARPELVVTVPAGEVACLEVRVVNTDGAASGESQQVCSP